MKIYADTSFLASLYLPNDARHGDALAVVNTWTVSPRLPFTPFAMLELRNVLARLQYKGRLHMGDARAFEQLVRDDLQAGILDAYPFHACEWMDATFALVEKVTPLTGTRTLDVMHIAFAKLCGAKTFLSFDTNQRKAAKAAGFALLPV